jgi:hypothetical protein
MIAVLHTALADLDPGDAGWGDVIFVGIWAIATLVLAAYYCYRSFLTR